MRPHFPARVRAAPAADGRTGAGVSSEDRADRGTDFGGPAADWSDLPGEVLPAQVYAAPAVLLVLLVTLAGGRCCPEPSWIDRTGRAVGVLWLLLSMLIALDRAESMGIEMSELPE